MEIIAQSSRFHTTATATAGDWDGNIVVEDFDLSVSTADRTIPLLHKASLKLHAGHRYALMGRNGVGKSVLMESLASRQLLPLAEYLSVQMVSQTHAQVTAEESQLSVLDFVCSATRERARRRRLIQSINRTLEAPTDRECRVAAAEYRKFRDIQLIAQLELDARVQSGRRGREARDRLLELQGLAPDPSESIDQIHRDLRQELDALMLQHGADDDGGELERQEAKDARRILSGLGFSTAASRAQTIDRLSGGWRQRCMLARALLMEPDVLLLDEPTNHLDIAGILWLQSHIHDKFESSIVVIVSHDRAFVNGVATDVIVMRDKQLTPYVGNWDEYELKFAERQQYMSRLRASLDRNRLKMQQSIQSAKTAARASGDDKRMSAMASKQKKLDERMGMERNSKGHRFKLNRDRAGWHDSMRDEVKVDGGDPPIVIHFPEPAPFRHAGDLLQVESLTFGYGDSHALLKDITLTVSAGDRVAIVGVNGVGKSTLLECLVSQSRHLATTSRSKMIPKKGSVAYHPECRPAYFSQYAVEELKQGEYSDKSPLQYLGDRAGQPPMPEQQLRAALARFGLQGKICTDTPVANLSGGQSVRVILAEMFLGAGTAVSSPHLLLLDEPSNHLDMPTIDALTEALVEYSGALILVSHDRTMVELVANRVLTIVDGQLVELKGGMREYIEKYHH